MNVARIIQPGSTKHDLHSIALRIYEKCIKLKNHIIPVWLPREENTIADFFSRPNDTDNFSIDYRTFRYIQKKLGKCTIDRFADDKNSNYRVLIRNSYAHVLRQLTHFRVIGMENLIGYVHQYI